jgi:epoxyqueuosine reductase
MKPRLLLHTCCACCTPKMLDYFSPDFEVLCFWFNPNIQPETEYSSRYGALKSYLETKGTTLISREDYGADRWTEEAVKTGARKPSRCRFCWSLRLEACAQAAKKESIDFFSTTMISSPYQDFEVLKDIGAGTAKAYGLEFVLCDIRKQYYEGVDAIKGMKLFTQRYCGCLYSKEEREAEKKKKKI